MNGGVLGVTNTPTTEVASGVWTLPEQRRWQQGSAWPVYTFTPSDLFSAGEQGVWYDPSDFSTMFQDSAGTTPVTAIEQPVGRILDKSGRGNTATQGVTTNRPTLRNLYNLLICQTTMATQNITTLAASYTLRFTGTGTVTLSGTATGTLSAGSNVFTATSGTLTLTVSGTVSEAMLTPTNEASLPFQSVTSNTLGSGVYNTDLTKFKPYLFFDGSDDWLQTSNINFSATDKMSAFAGIRKRALSAYTNLVFEISATSSTNPGVFSLFAPSFVATEHFYWRSAGTIISNAIVTSAQYNAFYTGVVTGFGDISGDSAICRINGTQEAKSTTDQGSGNYGNYPLYIGRRGGTTLPFNGRIYSLIIRGALTSSPQLEQTEQWVAAKTGVTL